MSKSLFVAFILAMTLTACGSKTEEPKPATDAAATTGTPAAAAPTAPAAGTDEEKERIRKQNAAAEAALSGH